MVQWGRKKIDPRSISPRKEEKVIATVFKTIPQQPLFTDDLKFKQNLEDPLTKKRYRT